LIIAEGTYDADALCLDVLGLFHGYEGRECSGAMVWGDPWDVGNWEVSEGFVGKWGWLLKGCQELVEATNYWRGRSGGGRLWWWMLRCWGGRRNGSVSNRSRRTCVVFLKLCTYRDVTGLKYFSGLEERPVKKGDLNFQVALSGLNASKSHQLSRQRRLFTLYHSEFRLRLRSFSFTLTFHSRTISTP
jgi:hypothetical protein